MHGGLSVIYKMLQSFQKVREEVLKAGDNPVSKIQEILRGGSSELSQEVRGAIKAIVKVVLNWIRQESEME